MADEAAVQIVFHLGAPFTDEGRLLRSLLEWRDALREMNVLVGDPEICRPVLRDALARSRRLPDPAALLSDMTEGQRPRRLIVLDESLLGQPLHVVRDRRLFGEAGQRAAQLAAFLPGHDLGFAIGLISPQTFMAHIGTRYDGPRAREAVGAVDPSRLSWLGVFQAITRAVPDAAILAWDHDDLPLLWDQILAELTALPPGQPVPGAFDILAEHLDDATLERLRAYLRSHPVHDAAQYRRVLRSFLRLFAAPGICSGSGGRLARRRATRKAGEARHEDDLLRIRRLPQVQLLQP